MQKLFLFLAAAVMLVACDNLKAKSGSSDEDKVETLKKKKPLKEDDEVSEDEEVSDDAKEKTRTRKGSNEMDEEVETDETNNDEDMTSDGDDEDAGTSNWPAVESKAFMTSCVKSATATFGASGAKEYCSCMMDKLQRKYPDYRKAAKLTEEDMGPMAKECVNQ